MKLIKEILLKVSAILNRNRESKILFYHDVYSHTQHTDMGTDVELFKKHIETIIKCGFNIVPKITEKCNQIQLCFDDGFKGIYDTKDIFAKYNIKPTVFLAVDLIGKEGYLNKEEIFELQEKGFIFQSHAWSHKNLTEFSGDDLEREIFGSKKYLTDLLGKDVDEICFPIGFFSKEVYDACINAGYNILYSSIPGNYFDFIIFDKVKTRNLIQFYSPEIVKSVLFGALKPFKMRYIKNHFVK
jgi:peptidoglycan/xylan/chitin deacetylase (PgdA/CDA1 family)